MYSGEARVDTGKTLFAQLMEFLPWDMFRRIVARYGGDHRVRTLACAEQYRVIGFAQPRPWDDYTPQAIRACVTRRGCARDDAMAATWSGDLCPTALTSTYPSAEASAG